jgi:hypothetical protein
MTESALELSSFLFFEESSQSRMAVINEPLFAKLNAAIDIQPAVSLEELIDKL